MQGSKVDNFLNEVLIYIKSPFDRDEIKEELEDHVNDMIEDYIEQGYSYEEAEEKSIDNIGNPKEIGVLLNEEHKPWIGWLLYITKAVSIILILFSVLLYGSILLSTLFTKNTVRSVDKSEIVYHIDLKDKVKIDDEVIIFTDIIYDTNGDLTFFYMSYDTRLWGSGWSSSYFGNYSDDLGNNQFGHSGASSSGFIKTGYVTLIEFDINAKLLTIEYDVYNRYYKVDIPLPGGYDD